MPSWIVSLSPPSRQACLPLRPHQRRGRQPVRALRGVGVVSQGGLPRPRAREGASRHVRPLHGPGGAPRLQHHLRAGGEAAGRPILRDPPRGRGGTVHGGVAVGTLRAEVETMVLAGDVQQLPASRQRRGEPSDTTAPSWRGAGRPRLRQRGPAARQHRMAPELLAFQTEPLRRGALGGARPPRLVRGGEGGRRVRGGGRHVVSTGRRAAAAAAAKEAKEGVEVEEEDSEEGDRWSFRPGTWRKSPPARGEDRVRGVHGDSSREGGGHGGPDLVRTDARARLREDL